MPILSEGLNIACSKTYDLQCKLVPFEILLKILQMGMYRMV